MNNSTYTTYAKLAYIISESHPSATEGDNRKLQSGEPGSGQGQVSAAGNRPSSKRGMGSAAARDLDQLSKELGRKPRTAAEAKAAKAAKAEKMDGRESMKNSDVYFHLGQIFLEAGNPFTGPQRATGTKARQDAARRTPTGAEHLPTAEKEENRAASRAPRDVKPTVTAKNRLARKRTESASKKRKALRSVAVNAQTPKEDK